MVRDPDFSLRQTTPQPDALLFLVEKERLWLHISAQGAQLPQLGEVCDACQGEREALLNNAFHIGRLALRDCFSICADDLNLPSMPGGEWVPFRQAFLLLEPTYFAMAGRAIQLQHWRHEHAFCSRCGAAGAPHAKEFAMVCKQCGFQQYPRINPCIIVLITKGDKALLAQGVRFPDGLFSCLAGFIEAGESAEQAVRREVREEVGITLGELRYHGSQSWPFPHSLMLGFHAQWQAGDLCPDAEEIVAADWFDRESLPRLPTSGSIARELIDAWLGATAMPETKQ